MQLNDYYRLGMPKVYGTMNYLYANTMQQLNSGSDGEPLGPHVFQSINLFCSTLIGACTKLLARKEKQDAMTVLYE